MAKSKDKFAESEFTKKVKDIAAIGFIALVVINTKINDVPIWTKWPLFLGAGALAWSLVRVIEMYSRNKEPNRSEDF